MQLGLSESARSTTAQEARFRIGYPNSSPRNSRIIALDEPSFEALRRLEELPWNGARFLRFVSARLASERLASLPVDATLEDRSGAQVGLMDEIGEADVVVMVTSGEPVRNAAEVIGNACFVRGKMTTGLILGSGEQSERGQRTLRAMRPYAAMLVVSADEEFVVEMLTALRV